MVLTSNIHCVTMVAYPGLCLFVMHFATIFGSIHMCGTALKEVPYSAFVIAHTKQFIYMTVIEYGMHMLTLALFVLPWAYYKFRCS